MKFAMLSAGVMALLPLNAMAQDLIFDPATDKRFDWSRMEPFQDMDLSGQTVTIFGTWLGDEADRFANIIPYFEQATGAKVTYTGSDNSTTQIRVDVESGSAPNLSIIPQPGFVADLAREGHLAPLTEDDATWVRENYAAGQSWVDLATFPGKDGAEHLWGIFFRVDLKSLLWYSPENFEDEGFDVPESWEELTALSEEMVARGLTPWCIGLGSGGATGWPGTDWIEEILLRTQPPEVYDAWVSHDIPFNDPRIVAAIETYGDIVGNPKMVAGGSVAASATDFRDSVKGLFTAPPSCFMHHQASFIPSFFPEGTEIGQDVDLAYFPASEEADLGKPVMGSGTMFVITDDSEATRAFLKFLESPISHELWMAQGSFLTPHLKADPALYASDVQRQMGDILLNATTFRFDGSDLMPGAVGAGSFWTGIVDFTAGRKTAQEMADAVEESWQ